MTCLDCMHLRVCDGGKYTDAFTEDDGVFTEGVENECPMFEKEHEWRNADEELPANDDLVLTIVNGKVNKNITLLNAYELMRYNKEFGWESDYYLFAKDIKVSYWMPLPKSPIKRGGDHNESN